MPSAKKHSSPMATSSGITSMIVLISHFLPTRIPAQRSQRGQRRVPERALPADSTRLSLTKTASEVQP